MTRQIDLRHDTDSTFATVPDKGLDILLSVDFARRIGVAGHAGCFLISRGQDCESGDVPVDDVHLDLGEGINLLHRRLGRVETAACVVEDTAVSVFGGILDVDGLLDLKSLLAVVDDDLGESGEGVESAPDGLGSDGGGGSGGDTHLEVSLEIVDVDGEGPDSPCAGEGMRGMVALLLGGREDSRREAVPRRGIQRSWLMRTVVRK
jgi:hypothetical protein